MSEAVLFLVSFVVGSVVAVGAIVTFSLLLGRRR